MIVKTVNASTAIVVNQRSLEYVISLETLTCIYDVIYVIMLPNWLAPVMACRIMAPVIVKYALYWSGLLIDIEAKFAWILFRSVDILYKFFKLQFSSSLHQKQSVTFSCCCLLSLDPPPEHKQTNKHGTRLHTSIEFQKRNIQRVYNSKLRFIKYIMWPKHREKERVQTWFLLRFNAFFLFTWHCDTTIFFLRGGRQI